MRRKDKQITDVTILKEILETSHICRLAIQDETYPYIVPMNYGYKDDKIYFHCASSGKKIDLLKKNNKVGFEIEVPHEIIKAAVSCDWTTRYRSIVGTGEIRFVHEIDKKRLALHVIMNQHGKFDNEYKPNLLKIISVLEMSIHSLSGKQSGDW